MAQIEKHKPAISAKGLTVDQFTNLFTWVEIQTYCTVEITRMVESPKGCEISVQPYWEDFDNCGWALFCENFEAEVE